MDSFPLELLKHVSGNWTLALSDWFKSLPRGNIRVAFGCDENAGNVIEYTILWQPLEYCVLNISKYSNGVVTKVKGKYHKSSFCKQTHLFDYNYVPCISLQDQFVQQIQVTSNCISGRSTHRAIHNLFLSVLTDVPKQTHPFMLYYSKTESKQHW